MATNEVATNENSTARYREEMVESEASYNIIIPEVCYSEKAEIEKYHEEKKHLREENKHLREENKLLREENIQLKSRRVSYHEFLNEKPSQGDGAENEEQSQGDSAEYVCLEDKYARDKIKQEQHLVYQKWKHWKNTIHKQSEQYYLQMTYDEMEFIADRRATKTKEVVIDKPFSKLTTCMHARVYMSCRGIIVQYKIWFTVIIIIIHIHKVCSTKQFSYNYAHTCIQISLVSR